jgi:hypothetical protein
MRKNESKLVIKHFGSVLQFELFIHSEREIRIVFSDGSEKIIHIANKPSISMCCPSEEGTVIEVFFGDDTSSFYDVETGDAIDSDFLDKVAKGERNLSNISVYK